MVAIKLREAMEAYRRRTGQRVTYKVLAERTGIAHGTLQIMGSQPGYNATLAILEKICRALDVTFGDLLELIDDPPNAKRAKKKTRKS